MDAHTNLSDYLWLSDANSARFDLGMIELLNEALL